jgi:solute carrier family 24 (sodium/potassium/calcium exchanger), member 6
MDLLRLFGFVTHLPTPMLALTVLAWGNSLGDLMANLSMTKKGFGEMAVTGCIAGPVFNLLVGNGLSSIKKLLKSASPLKSYILFSAFKPDGSLD